MQCLVYNNNNTRIHIHSPDTIIYVLQTHVLSLSLLPHLTSFTSSSFNGLMKTRRIPALINSVLVLASSWTVKPYTGMRGSNSFINWVAVDPSILHCPRSLSMMTNAYELVGIVFTYPLVQGRAEGGGRRRSRGGEGVE